MKIDSAQLILVKQQFSQLALKQSNQLRVGFPVLKYDSEYVKIHRGS